MVWLGSDYQHIPTKIHDKKHRVTLDSNEEDSFKIHMPNKIINLKISPNGLYIYIFPNIKSGSINFCDHSDM